MESNQGGEQRQVHFRTAKRFLALGCLCGLTAVLLGAFGSHILKRMLAESQLQLFETGIRYQFYHTFAIIFAGLVSRYGSRRWSEAAGWLFFSGIVLFSGSLYLIATGELLGAKNLGVFLGPLTPVGGTLFMTGWIALWRASINYERKK